MDICLIGDFNEKSDEGFKNIAHSLNKELSEFHDVPNLNIKSFFTFPFWNKIGRINPPIIIHYFSDPSPSSVIFLKFLRLIWKDPITVLSALHPQFTFSLKLNLLIFKPDLILTQSYQSDLFFNELNCRTQFLSNGVDLEKFYPVDPTVKNQLREKYGISKESFVVLHVGHIKKDRNVKLVIIGPDDGFLNVPAKQVKTLKIEDHTIFTGLVPEKEKLETFVDADLLVYPGILEIFGLVPFEALRCGTPVIVCDDCGCGEIIKVADCGYLVRYGDNNQLLEKIKYALGHQSENDKKVKNGQKFINEKLSWNRLVNEYENFITA